MRYFYTDPLAAAWMAKHFGMRYNDIEGDYHITDYLDLNWEDSCSESKAKYYIHPDSLQLLQPIDGDVVQGNLVGLFHGKNEQGWFYKTGDDAIAFTQVGKIIQRNNIPFMYPECEA